MSKKGNYKIFYRRYLPNIVTIGGEPMKSDIYTGLTEEEVKQSKEKYGTNQITTIQQTKFMGKLLETLGDPIIRILLIALGIKVVFLIKDFDWYETVGIVIAIFIASFISTISEYGSEQAFIKLQEESSKIKCRVRRNKKIQEISIDDVVVGDYILLESGDKIPADGIIIDGEISVDESSINGETKEAYKQPIKDIVTEKNQVYRGTVVYSNQATMIAKKIGNETLYGKLAAELLETGPESPLKIRLRGLAQIISKIGYVGAFLVSISYLFSVIFIANHFQMDLILSTITNFPIMIGHILYALTLSVTIIVVAVPEGLPMMITLVLSSNMKRMLKNNVLVRKMVGIETAGSINILFTDKTGTLTKGKLEVTHFVNGDLKEFNHEFELEPYPKLHHLFKLSSLYNNASTYDENKRIIGGNITDRALLQFITSNPNMNVQKVETVPFNSKEKYSYTTIIEANKKKKLIKGAPEKILVNCTHYYDSFGNKKNLYNKNNLNNYLNQQTQLGIRVLALAINDNYDIQNTFKDITLVGFVLIKDEVRKEAITGIELVKNAHIQTVMITGDNKNTAYTIGKEVGLIENTKDLVLTSDELKHITDEELKKMIPQLRIVARALPQDKSRLVRLAQELNLVVGMTGDGVNDAPALKKADVGFAMGSGTEVSKEASDIVILDDNFLSISKAILFGRTIFKSIRKFIIVQLTINFCAISLSIIGPFIGIDTPITVIQMLWINMVMDTLAGLAFAYEPPLLEYMKEYPKKKEEPIINHYMMQQIVVTGLYSAILCILFLKLPFVKDWFQKNNAEFMTAFFGLFIFIDIFNSFNARTNRLNLLAHIQKNRVFLAIMIFVIIVQIILIYYGGELFRTVGLNFKEFQIMIFLAATVIPIDWMRKLYLRSKGCIGGV